MKSLAVHRWSGQVLILMALVSFWGCGKSQQEPSKAVDRNHSPHWQEEYDEMVRVLAMSLSQEQELRAAFESTYGGFEQALSGEEGAKLVDEERSLRQAVKARDLAGVRRITRQKKTQRQGFRERIASGKEQILAVLSAEQRLQWDAHRISQELIDEIGVSQYREDLDESAFGGTHAAQD